NFLSGDGEDLHSTVLAVQRAGLEFDMLMQVRNKVVSAYQEVMRMQMSRRADKSLTPMDQVKRIVGTLSGRQLTTILLVAVLVAGGIYGFTQWQREAGFRPLYTNALAPEDAALVV